MPQSLGPNVLACPEIYIYIYIFMCTEWLEREWMADERFGKKDQTFRLWTFSVSLLHVYVFFFLVAYSKPLIDNLHTCRVCSICHVRNAPVSVPRELVHDHSRLYDSYTYLQWADTEVLTRSSWNCSLIRYRPTCNGILNCIKSLVSDSVPIEQPQCKMYY